MLEILLFNPEPLLLRSSFRRAIALSHLYTRSHLLPFFVLILLFQTQSSLSSSHLLNESPQLFLYSFILYHSPAVLKGQELAVQIIVVPLKENQNEFSLLNEQRADAVRAAQILNETSLSNGVSHALRVELAIILCLH